MKINDYLKFKYIIKSILYFLLFTTLSLAVQKVMSYTEYYTLFTNLIETKGLTFGDDSDLDELIIKQEDFPVQKKEDIFLEPSDPEKTLVQSLKRIPSCILF